jgi:hypothetical protein
MDGYMYIADNGDKGILIAPSKHKANQLKRFLNLKGKFYRMATNDDTLIRVIADYSIIDKTKKLLAELRKA